MDNTKVVLGVSKTAIREKDDFYATDPKAIDLLLKMGGVKLKNPLLEPSCGMGHLSERLKQYGYDVKSMDLIDRGYGETGIDFLKYNEKWQGDIITNPPYKLAKQFIEHALDILETRGRAYMFLKVQYLEGISRAELFEKKQLKTIYVFTKRITCDTDCDFSKSSAVAYAWFEFEKDWNDEPKIKWLNENKTQQTFY